MDQNSATSSNSSSSNIRDRANDLEKIIGEAEGKLRQGLDMLSSWSEQTRDVLQNRPGIVLASIAIAGFMSGMILRKGPSFLKNTERSTTPGTSAYGGDPLIVFLSGALAGFTVGPRVLREVALGPDFGSASASSKVTRIDPGAPIEERVNRH